MVYGPATLKILVKHKYTAASTWIRKLESIVVKDVSYPIHPKQKSTDSAKSVSCELQYFSYMPQKLSLYSIFFEYMPPAILKYILEPKKNDPINLETLQKPCRHYLFYSYHVVAVLKVSWNFKTQMKLLLYLVCHGAFILYTAWVIFQLMWLTLLEVSLRQNITICLKSL